MSRIKQWYTVLCVGYTSRGRRYVWGTVVVLLLIDAGIYMQHSSIRTEHLLAQADQEDDAYIEARDRELRALRNVLPSDMIPMRTYQNTEHSLHVTYPASFRQFQPGKVQDGINFEIWFQTFDDVSRPFILSVYDEARVADLPELHRTMARMQGELGAEEQAVMIGGYRATRFAFDNTTLDRPMLLLVIERESSVVTVLAEDNEYTRRMLEAINL